MRTNATVPIWHEDIKIWTYRPSIDGRQRKFISHKSGPAGAKECIRKYNSALGGQDKSNIRLDKAWEEYLEDKKKRLGEHSDSYIKAFSMGKTHLVPPLKLKKVSRITEQDWQDVLNDAKPARGGHAVMAKKSLMNLRGEIMAFGKFCKKSGYISEKWEDLSVPRTAPTIGKQILSREALKTFLSEDTDEWYINVWRLMVTTGMRPGEVYGLHRADVENGLIQIRRSINNHKRLTEGKNTNAIRTMVQKPIDLRIIAAQLEKHALLNDQHIVSPWLFCDEFGARPNPLVISHHWAKYRSRLGASVTQYGLRHTFVSHSKSVLPDALLKGLVGHSTSMDTVGVYGHKVDGDDTEAARIVSTIFDSVIG